MSRWRIYSIAQREDSVKGEGSAAAVMEIIDQSRISLPPNSAPPSVVPLSFLDLPFFFLRATVQRVLFYNLPGFSAHQFTDTALPSIKRSLSAALQSFFPLAGGMACVLPSGKPQILCSDSDSVNFITAVSSADFDELTSDSPQAASLLNHLVPPLGPSVVKDGTRVAPLLAVQATFFANKGMCIGVQFHHAAADGLAFSHFMKTWASICRSELEGAHTTCTMTALPVLDRSLIKDPDGLETILLEDGWNHFSPLEENSMSSNPSPGIHDGKLRATFTLSRARINKLKTWISNQAEPGGSSHLHLSTFVATCAYTWTCLIKSRDIGEPGFSNKDVCHFIFVADCRGRSRLGYQIPDTYFGNCLAISYVALKREELVGGEGVVSAARAIGAKVRELEGEGGPLREMKRGLSYTKEITEKGCFVMVTGTPRQRYYDTDFGWGRPWKSRAVHIVQRGSISLAESREEEGGVEVGLALGKASMDAFCVMFEHGLRSLNA